MLSAGSIIAGGFRVLRERPLAFLIWTLLYLAATVAIALVTRGMVVSMQAGAISPLGYFARILPFSLLMSALMLVLFNAAQRAVLREEADSFFYLRLGMDELRVFLVSLILSILIYVALIAVMLVAVMVFAGLAATVGTVIAGSTGVIAFALALALVVWLYVRFSLAAPLTLIRRKIIIGESWRATRGRFWSLFGAYLALFLIVIVLAVAASAAASGSYWMDLVSGGFSPLAAQRAAQAQLARQTGAIGPLTIIGWILGSFSGTLTLAIIGGAGATAAKALVVDADRIAETFA